LVAGNLLPSIVIYTHRIKIHFKNFHLLYFIFWVLFLPFLPKGFLLC
jgi:hypothetical protein